MERRLEVEGLLRAALGAGLAPGFAALALEGEGGAVWAVGRRTTGGPDTTADTLYDLASLTKPLATTTLVLLARRDGLDLETPLADLLPELSGTAFGAATVELAASHTAGFPAWAPLYALGPCTPDGYAASIARLEPVGRPGERVVYSCPGFIALGLALERAGGAGLAALFHDLVVEPLGLAGEIGYCMPASLPAAEGESEPFVERALLSLRGVAGDPPASLAGVLSPDDGNARGLGGATGNAGLFGTAAAVAALAAEYLPGGGELLTADEARLATTGLTSGLEQVRGLGWQLAATPGCSAGPALPADGFGHSGFTGTSVWVDPGRSRVLVLLGNRLHPGGRTPDLHPLRRRFNQLAAACLPDEGDEG